MMRLNAHLSMGQIIGGLEFNPYEVAPYSEGFVVIEVPLSLVRPYLTPFAKSVFQSK